MTILPSFARPMNIGDLFGHAISVYRKNFLAMVGIVAVISVPLLLIDIVAAPFALSTDLLVLAGRSTSQPSSGLPYLIFFLTLAAMGFIGAIAFVFQAGALSIATSEFFLGRRCTIKAAYSRALRRGLALFASVLIIGLLNLIIFLLGLGVISVAILVTFFVVMLPMFTDPPPPSSYAETAFTCVSLCAYAALGSVILPFALLNIHWILTPQAIVLENLGVRAGMRQSWRLVRGSVRRVLLIGLPMWLFISLLTITPSAAISVAALALLPSPMQSNLAIMMAQTTLNIFVIPIQFAILTMLYYDLRIRQEGFDLEFNT